MRKNSMLITAVLLVVLATVFAFVGCDEEITKYTLTLDGGEGELTQVTDVNIISTAPEAPTKEGYRFDGWYTDAELTQKAVFPMVLSADTTLYAKWTQIFTVTYETNGGSEVAPFTGEVVETAPLTYRDGYFFGGWYLNPKLTGKAITFPYELTADVTLYAKWTEDAASEEYRDITSYPDLNTSLEAIKSYFEKASAEAIDFDTVLTTTSGSARVQFKANVFEGASAEVMFKVTMLSDNSVGFAVYAKDDELYIDLGNGAPVIHVSDVRMDYLVAMLQQAGVKIDLEELLSNIGGFNIYDLLMSLILDTPEYKATQRIATGELVYESYTFEVKVNSLVSGVKGLLGLFDLSGLLGFELNLTPVFDWLEAAIPQVKLYWNVECKDGALTSLKAYANDNASGSEGDELINWRTENIGFYDFPIAIDMPSDMESESVEFSFSNIAFDIDLNIATNENGLDIGALIAMFTDQIALPQNTLVLQSDFGFRLKARVDLDLNYANANVDNNLMAFDLYKLNAQGELASEKPILGIYYKDGAIYVSVADIVPDYWKANNIRVDVNLDAVISDLVKLITSAIDGALGTEWKSSELNMSTDSTIEATLTEGEDGEIAPIISPTISGLITAVASVIGLQENIYVDDSGDSIIIDVNQKFFDAINAFMPDNKITLPSGINDLSLAINCFEGGIKDITASAVVGEKGVNDVEVELMMHNFTIGFLEGELENLSSYIDNRVQDYEFSNNLGEIIFGILNATQIDLNAKVSLEEGTYAIGKLLSGFGVGIANEFPLLEVPAGVELDAILSTGISIDSEVPERSKFAVELKINNNGVYEKFAGVYGYYEEGKPYIVADLTEVAQGIQLPLIKVEFDFANTIIDLIKNIKIGNESLSDYELSFDLSDLITADSSSEQVASVLMTSTDNTVDGTELSDVGKIVLGINADKITANIALSAVIALLKNFGIDLGVDLSSLNIGIGLEASGENGISLDIEGELPKNDDTNGKFALALQTGTADYPLTIGQTDGLESAIDEVQQKQESISVSTTNLSDVIFELLSAVELNAKIDVSAEQGTYAIGKLLSGFGLSIANDSPLLTIGEGMNASFALFAGLSINKEVPTDSQFALELKAMGEDGQYSKAIGVYGYYENGSGYIVVDASNLNLLGATLPVYKAKFDFAGTIIDLINGITVGDSTEQGTLNIDISDFDTQDGNTLVEQSDGTAQGTTLTDLGGIIVSLNKGKLTASVTLTAIVNILKMAGVDLGIDLSSLNAGLELGISTESGLDLDINAMLPKAENAGEGALNIALHTASAQYPVVIGSRDNLSDAIDSAKEIVSQNTVSETNSLSELILSLLQGVEINAGININLEQGTYVLGKILKGFGLDTAGNNPTFGISEAYSLDAKLLVAFNLDGENVQNSRTAIELRATRDGGVEETIFGLYAYYNEEGVSTILLDLSNITISNMTLPIYKFEFDFATALVTLINSLQISANSNASAMSIDVSEFDNADGTNAVVEETDGTVGGTTLTDLGGIIIAMNKDKITASVTLTAVMNLLSMLGVNVDIDLSALDVKLDLTAGNTDGLKIDLTGNLPKEGDNEYGALNVALQTGSSEYPISIGTVVNLDEAIARAKALDAQAQTSIYDILFDTLNSVQASISINLENSKEVIDITSIINSILAMEGSLLTLPINATFDANSVNLYLDAMWNIDLQNPLKTKIYIEMRYESKKILSLGIDNGNLYVDLEGLGLFEFKVINSKMATSLFEMIDKQLATLKEFDLGEVLTELIAGFTDGTMMTKASAEEGGDTVEDGTSDTNGDAQSTDSTTAIITSILGGLSVYDGVIKLNLATTTFSTIFKALLGADIGLNIAVDDAQIDLNNGTIDLPVVFNDTINLGIKLAVAPAAPFEVTSDTKNELDATDGTTMARKLLEHLNMDFNIDILNNSVETNGLNKFLRVRIVNVLEGQSLQLAGTKDNITVYEDTLVVSLYQVLSEENFNDTTKGYGDPILHLELGYSEAALTPNADGTPAKNMKIHLAKGKFAVKVIGITVDIGTMGLVTDNLKFNMDIITMLSGLMDSIIKATDFSGTSVAATDETVEEGTTEVATYNTTEEPAQPAAPGPFDNLDIMQLLSGGINVTFLSTGTLNANISLDPYIFNKLIDDILGGMVFGENSTVNLAELAPDMFKEHYLQKVAWDRINKDVFWRSLREQLRKLIEGIVAAQVGDTLAGAVGGPVGGLLDGTIYNLVSALLPLPVYNEVNVGLNLIDGTLANIYLEGYDYNQPVTNENGEVLTFERTGLYENGSSAKATLTYGNNRSLSYKTELNLYDCFSSVGDPSNTPDGSYTEGIVNWGDIETALVFEPYEYPDDNQKAYDAFYNEYFKGKIATYQRGTTIVKGQVKFMLQNAEGGYEDLTISNLNLLQIAKNENGETTYLNGKVVATFSNGIVREIPLSITVYPVGTIGAIEPIEMHVYDSAPDRMTVHFTNKTTRTIKTSTIAGISYNPTGIEGGSTDMEVTFANGVKANLTVNYLNSVATAIGNNGEVNVYEYDLYSLDSTLDIMAKLPQTLFFSYENGDYGYAVVDEWIIEQSVLDEIKAKQSNDLSAIEFKAIAVIDQFEVTEQEIELTIRLKNKQVESVIVNGGEDEYLINPYDYYMYLINTDPNKAPYPSYPSNIKVNYNDGITAYSENVNVVMTSDFDFSSIGYNTMNTGTINVSLDESKYGGYFDWNKDITLKVLSNILKGIYFDDMMTQSSVNIDTATFNAMTAEQKANFFPSEAIVKFDNGYTLKMPIRWTDRNGFPVDLNTLTFENQTYSKTMYAEIGYSEDSAIRNAFYQRIEVKVYINQA